MTPVPNLKIAVLMGGTSEERDVSLASGSEVARALRERGHEVVAIDTTRGALTQAEERALLDTGVSVEPPAGELRDLLGTGDTSLVTRNPDVSSPDVIFLTLHGGAGEDGTIQSLLDFTGIPYVGSGRVGCALAMDKDLTKRLLRDAGIPTPEWITGHAGQERVERELGFPVIVKPPSGGSTVGLTLVREAAELAPAERQARAHGGGVMFERYVRGRELTVGILGDEALPVGEIISEHEIFDYECKYQPGMAREIFPADVPADVSAQLRRLALEVHSVLRLEGFSRVDFILDESGTAWCLEANALPGLATASLLPKAAGAAGLSFGQLCERIAELALAKRSRAAVS